MIIIYTALITFALCAAVPVIYDHFLSRRESATWSRRLAAYSTMTFFALLMPLMASNIYFDWLSAILAVAIAVMIADITLFGTIFVLAAATVAFPTAVLLELASLSKIDMTLKLFIEKIELQYLLLPMILGVAALFIVRDQVKRRNWKRD